MIIGMTEFCTVSRLDRVKIDILDTILDFFFPVCVNIKKSEQDCMSVQACVHLYMFVITDI